MKHLISQHIVIDLVKLLLHSKNTSKSSTKNTRKIESLSLGYRITDVFGVADMLSWNSCYCVTKESNTQGLQNAYELF